ncbi:hypothetical protein EVAR_9848_1 [Eumeta japonica]|uniref:Reverse transcriptase domain-containing protein n=1 Tax=Eumeta variegata TaxID=151549 RepID=A0A4C1TQ82_EUMVA|nr:hypothetical protein EVAR_9848_1 [Eumeta japonica]
MEPLTVFIANGSQVLRKNPNASVKVNFERHIASHVLKATKSSDNFETDCFDEVCIEDSPTIANGNPDWGSITYVRRNLKKSVSDESWKRHCLSNSSAANGLFCDRTVTETGLKRIKTSLELNQPVEQAGFRKEFSTIDHIHTLKLLTERYQEKRGPLYIVYIDYQKAVDTVAHESIWEALKKPKCRTTVHRTHQNFADDLVILAETCSQPQYVTEPLNGASMKAGLETKLL